MSRSLSRGLGGCAGTLGTVVLPVAASSSQSPGTPFSWWTPRDAKPRPALSTSAPLQAISEKRAHEMAEMNSDYAGHDVYVDIKNAGLCTKSQREISGVGISQAGREAEERLEQEHLHGRALAQPAAFAALGANSMLTPEEEEFEIPIEAKWVVLGVGVVESGSSSYYAEDFAEPC